MTRKNISSLAVVVLIGLILQVGLITLDCTNTPSDTAVAYARDYYRLSDAMSTWLCGGASATCSKPGSAQCANADVTEHIYAATADVAERGFGRNLAKYTLSHIETRTEYLNESTAVVHLTARRRLAINPLYAYVARLFRLGESHEIEETFRVQLQDGRWRVCDASLSLLKVS